MRKLFDPQWEVRELKGRVRELEDMLEEFFSHPYFEIANLKARKWALNRKKT